MASDSIVEKMIADFEEKARQVKKIYGLLKKLNEYDSTVPLPDPTLNLEDGDVSAEAGGKSYKIEVGEFFGKTQTQAAVAFLRKVKKPTSLDNIYNALMRGGIKFEGSNGKNALNVQLTRATGWFAKIPGTEETTFGLCEWYEKKRGRPKGTGKVDSEEPEAETPSEIEVNPEVAQ